MVASTSWKVWGLEASLTVTDASLLDDATRIVQSVIADVDTACNRFRADSELSLKHADLAAGATVSETLAQLVSSALEAARWTDGSVDPTLGRDMAALGYDRDISEVKLLDVGAPVMRVQQRPRSLTWEHVRLEGNSLLVPSGLRLDLGATAKAVASDWAAQRIATEGSCGVLVSLGGDIATAGPAPAEGWQILVQDTPVDPRQQVTLQSGHGMATSSTQKRRWRHAGAEVHHILDPRFGQPVVPVWRSVTVAASSCLLANAFSTAGVVRGFAAVNWFKQRGISGRFIDQQGRTVTTGSWPQDDMYGTTVDPAELMSVSRGQHHG